jgi:hypothetical protein
MSMVLGSKYFRNQNDGGLSMEIVGQILLAILSAIIGAFASWVMSRIKAKKDAAIAYLESVCLALEGMITDFRTRKIPHDSGRTFIGILDVFRDYMKPHMSGDTEGLIFKLRSLAEKSQSIDFDLYRDYEPQEIEHWIVSAERAIGDLRAELAKIKGKQ